MIFWQPSFVLTGSKHKNSQNGALKNAYKRVFPPKWGWVYKMRLPSPEMIFAFWCSVRPNNFGEHRFTTWYCVYCQGAIVKHLAKAENWEIMPQQKRKSQAALPSSYWPIMIWEWLLVREPTNQQHFNKRNQFNNFWTILVYFCLRHTFVTTWFENRVWGQSTPEYFLTEASKGRRKASPTVSINLWECRNTVL